MVRVARYARHTWIVATVSALAVATMTQSVGAQSDSQAAVNAANAKFKDFTEGKNADYIPALAKVDPNLFGIALVTADGKVYTAGDISTEVSIQSIAAGDYRDLERARRQSVRAEKVS